MATTERNTKRKDEEMNELSKKEIIKLLETTYKKKYNTLVERTEHKYKFDRQEAEDLVQEVFLENFKDCKYKGKADATIETYLFSCIKNRAYDKYQANKKYIYCHIDNEKQEDLLQDYYSEDKDATKEYYDTIDTLRRELKKLNPQQAEAINLFYFENKSQKEIAQKLGCNTGTVEQLIYRAKRKIQNSSTLKCYF